MSDLWVVVNGHAYDVTKRTQMHPGGIQAITAFAGQDASEEWHAILKANTIEKNIFQGTPMDQRTRVQFPAPRSLRRRTWS